MYNISIYLNKSSNIHTFLCELFEQVCNNMVQCSTASSTNHCICDKTQRSWLALLYKGSIVYSNKIKPQLVIPVQFTALNYWPSVSDYTFLNVAVRFTV